MYKVSQTELWVKIGEGRHANFTAEGLLHNKPSVNYYPYKNSGQAYLFYVLEKSNLIKI